MFGGPTATAQQNLEVKYATINPSYYSTFLNAHETPDGEPVDAQAVYKTLDPVMLAVLTNQNANIANLLAGATSQVNQILSISG